MQLIIDLDEVEQFCEEYLAEFLVQNTTSFESAAFILQAVLDKITESRKILQEQQYKQRNKGIEAYWEIEPDGYYPVCSLCKKEPEEGKHVICPNCGATMIDERACS